MKDDQNNSMLAGITWVAVVVIAVIILMGLIT